MLAFGNWQLQWVVGGQWDLGARNCLESSCPSWACDSFAEVADSYEGFIGLILLSSVISQTISSYGKVLREPGPQTY